LIVRRGSEAHTGIADQIPADEAIVAAVERIAEGALNRVREQEVEECRRPARKTGRRVSLHVGEHGVLVLRRELRERCPLGRAGIAIECGEALAIRVTRRSERPAERPVDVTRGPCLGRTGPVRIGRDQARDDGIEDVGLDRRQRLERSARRRRDLRECVDGNGGGSASQSDALQRVSAGNLFGHRNLPVRLKPETTSSG
jgi:hypothetical protein